MIDVVKKIDLLRNARGWSIYKLSVETGLSQQAIHAWYNSSKQSVPSIVTLEIVCQAFGITLAEFFDENRVETKININKIYDNWCSLSKDDQTKIEMLIKRLLIQ